MVKRNYFSHETPGRGSAREVIEQFGYDADLTGENICWGERTAEEAFDTWVTSQDHLENMVSPHYAAIGIGGPVGAEQDLQRALQADGRWLGAPRDARQLAHDRQALGFDKGRGRRCHRGHRGGGGRWRRHGRGAAPRGAAGGGPRPGAAGTTRGHDAIIPRGRRATAFPGAATGSGCRSRPPRPRYWRGSDGRDRRTGAAPRS